MKIIKTDHLFLVCSDSHELNKSMFEKLLSWAGREKASLCRLDGYGSFFAVRGGEIKLKDNMMFVFYPSENETLEQDLYNHAHIIGEAMLNRYEKLNFEVSPPDKGSLTKNFTFKFKEDKR